MVAYDTGRDAFDLEEPLARRARRAGVVVARVEYDAARDAMMRVDFDGRIAFSVELDRVSPLFQ